MGSSLQEILQGRDVKKGHGIDIKRFLLPLLLCISYAGLIFGLPVKNPVLWFPFSFLVAAAYAFLNVIKRRKRYSLEALSSLFLLIAGGIQFSNQHWLHVVYIPCLVALSLFYGPRIMAPLCLAVPLLELPHFIRGNLREEFVLSAAAVLTGAGVSFTLSRIKKERDGIKKTLDSLREEAEDSDAVTGFDITGGEGFLSEHLSSTNTANEEMREILNIATQTMSADSAGVFMLRENVLHLRCSAGEAAGEKVPKNELLKECIGKRQSITFNSPAADALAHIAAPVIDGNYVLGLLVISCGGPKTFREADIETAEMFSAQVARIIQRQRVYSQLRREHLMLKKLKDGGSKLIGSLKIDDIAGSLVDAAYSIAPQERISMALFMPRDDKFELIRQVGLTVPERSVFDLKNTRLGLAGKSGEPDYISDLRNERSTVFPFKINVEGSVFILPLSYEKELLGIFALLSPAVDSIHPYQIELLKVLGNQASSSLANAKFHSEMEKMATTDGLTGLFNHRNFQEKLSAEIRRLQRFSDPLSLLLVDIDFFKKVNDNHGHPAGDEILRGVARVIKETIRDIDIPARYGGEEFAALLPGTDRQGAARMAERLRSSVAGKIYNIDGKDLSVTVSIGAATSPYDANNKEELIEKADQALYHAKRNGRNKCVIWSEMG